jgi:hypothetical protein
MIEEKNGVLGLGNLEQCPTKTRINPMIRCEGMDALITAVWIELCNDEVWSEGYVTVDLELV